LFCADVAVRVAGEWTLNRRLLNEARLVAFQSCSPRTIKQTATRNKKGKRNKRTYETASLAGGCRLPSPSRRQPRPRTPFPTQLPFDSRQGTAGSSVRMTVNTGCPLAGSGEVGVVGRDSGGQSLFLPDGQLRAGANFAIAELDHPSRTRPSIPVPLRGLPQMCDRRCAPSPSLSNGCLVWLSSWRALFVRKGRGVHQSLTWPFPHILSVWPTSTRDQYYVCLQKKKRW
jgi:hypothetical protein